MQVKNEIGQTPLHEAANQGHAKIVERLLQEGADPRTRDNVCLLYALCNSFFYPLCVGCNLCLLSFLSTTAQPSSLSHVYRMCMLHAGPGPNIGRPVMSSGLEILAEAACKEPEWNMQSVIS